MTDQAIEFEATLHKVNKTINRLKKANLDTSKYEDIVIKIKSECEEETTSDYNNNFNVAFLEQGYIKGKTKLERLYSELEKYEIYLIIASFSNVLRNFLNSDNKRVDELNNLRSTLFEMLHDLRYSDTLDYEVEGGIVEDIYHLAYEFIKLELNMLGTSPTLLKIKSDEVHTLNLDKQISKELEKLDLKDPKYHLVVASINKIESMGIDATYVSSELISNLANSTKSKEELEKELLYLEERLDIYYEKALDLEKQYKSKMSESETNDITFHRKKILKSGIKITLSIGLALGLIKGAWELSKLASKQKEYKNTTIIYDLDTGKEEITESYLTNDKDQVYLKTYTPYSKTKDEFSRVVTTYNVTDVGSLDYTDYIYLDLEALGIEKEIEVETKKELSLVDLYEADIMEIEKILVNKEDMKEELFEAFPLIVILGLIIAMLVDVTFELIQMLITHNEKETIGVVGLFNHLFNLQYDIKNLIELKDKDKINKEELKAINDRALKLIKDNENIINRLIKELPLLEGYPEYQARAKDLDDTLKRIRKIEDKTIQG